MGILDEVSYSCYYNDNYDNLRVRNIKVTDFWGGKPSIGTSHSSNSAPNTFQNIWLTYDSKYARDIPPGQDKQPRDGEFTPGERRNAYLSYQYPHVNCFSSVPEPQRTALFNNLRKNFRFKRLDKLLGLYQTGRDGGLEKFDGIWGFGQS